MTTHEISPKQVRALLFLLVLVPFIPLVLMMRFLTDAVEGESDAARERFANATQHTLVSATAALEKRLATRTTPADPEELRRICHEVFDRTIEISVRDANGRVVAGPARPAGKLVAQTSIKHLDTAWPVGRGWWMTACCGRRCGINSRSTRGRR